MSKSRLDLAVPHGVMFHHFTGPGRPPSQGAITGNQLRGIIEGLGRDTFLSADEWIERFLAGTLPEGARCVTFDDALRCQYDIALPVLEDMGLKAMFFIYTAHMEGHRPLLEIYRHFRSMYFASPNAFYDVFHEAVVSAFGDWPRQKFEAIDSAAWPFFPDFYSPEDRKFQMYRDQVLSTAEYDQVMDRAMAAYDIDQQQVTQHVMMGANEVRELHRLGHTIGLHSHSHPLNLSRFSEEEQRDEYARCHTWVERLTGCAPISMSHPSNAYSASTLAILASLDVRVGFRANVQMLTGGPLEIPRLDHTECRIALGL